MAQLAREVAFGRTSSVLHPDEFTGAAPPRNLSRSSRLSLDLHDVEAAAPLIPRASQAIENVPHIPSLAPNVAEAFSKRVRIGINASWGVNILLLIAKVAAFVISGSYAVLASAVDSLVDVLSQAILAVAEYQAARFDQRFPIGRTRIAELSVMACACIMFVSTSLVIREALGCLWEGFHGHVPPLMIDETLYLVLGTATLLKLALYVYCRALRKNPIMVALSEDHLNDVMSNVAAVCGASVASRLPHYWYVDPAVALLFSLLIIRNWLAICWEQAQKMIGLEAPEELVEEVREVTREHHPVTMKLDRVTAYHHGSHMVVEVEVVMPALMTVRESHDIALALQHKIEALDSVERAFVHVDYERRSVEEHKVERNLKLGEKDVMKPLAGLEPPLLRSRSTGGSGSASAAAVVAASVAASAAASPSPASAPVTPVGAAVPEPTAQVPGNGHVHCAEPADGSGAAGSGVVGA